MGLWCTGGQPKFESGWISEESNGSMVIGALEEWKDNGRVSIGRNERRSEIRAGLKGRVALARCGGL
jgi:hypothetical protein